MSENNTQSAAAEVRADNIIAVDPAVITRMLDEIVEYAIATKLVWQQAVESVQQRAKEEAK